MTIMTHDNEKGYFFTQEPVTAPPGFANPTFRIGDRVRIAMSILNPLSRAGTLYGSTGSIISVIFCKSDGNTVLYGVRLDSPDQPILRCKGFELDDIG